MSAQVVNLPQALQNQVVGNKTLTDAGGVAQCIDGWRGVGSQDAVTASTTQTQAGGTKITAAWTVIATANGSDAITFPPAIAGRALVIVNTSGQTIQAFPASAAQGGVTGGDAINAAGANTAVTIANVTTSTYYCIKAGQWWGGATTNEQ